MVATVTSRLASFTHSRTVLTLFPTASPMSHRKARRLLTFSLSTAAHRSPGEDEQIDVRAREQLATPVAAHRDERVAGLTVESESAPGECQDTVHEPRSDLDERGHRLGPGESALPDGTGSRRGSREPPGNGACTSIGAASGSAAARVCGSAARVPWSLIAPYARSRAPNRRSRWSFSARAAVLPARAPSRDSCRRRACRAVSCLERSRAEPSHDSRSNACRGRSGYSRAARRRR